MLFSTVAGLDRYHVNHVQLLGPLIRERRPGVELHHSQDTGGHVVAFAPLSETLGGVIFEEHRDPVLALGHQLRRTLLILGSTVMLLATFASWLYLRYIVGPVLALKKAVDRISTGELDQPAVVDRQDEIGALALAFETMRTRLREARDKRLQ